MSNLNDVVNCHIDHTTRSFQEINDKFTFLSKTVKVQTDSAISSVEDVYTEVQLVKSNVDTHNKMFLNKSNSFWDKLNSVSKEIVQLNTRNTTTEVQLNTGNTTTDGSKPAVIENLQQHVNYPKTGTAMP